MPLVKRHVEPTKLANRKIPAKTSNELELVTNSTLSNTLLQLSSLSFYAQDVFAELGVEVKQIGERINSMQDRVQETDTRVEVLSSGGKDTVSVDKQVGFGSKRNESSARVLDRSTMPEEMCNFYNSTCHPPPALHIFDSCRPPEDPVSNSLKLYTDPDFFFELWRDKIQQANRMDLQRRQKNKKRNVSRMQRKPSTAGIEAPTTRKEQWKQQGQGKELAELGANNTMRNPNQRQLVNGNQYYGQNGMNPKNGVNNNPNHFQTLPSKISSKPSSSGISSNFSPTSPQKQNSQVSSSSQSNMQQQKSYNLNEHPLHHSITQTSTSKLSPVRKNFNTMPAPPPLPGQKNIQHMQNQNNSNLRPIHPNGVTLNGLPNSIHPDSNTSNIGRQTSISKLPPPPNTLNYENMATTNVAHNFLSPPMPSPPKNSDNFDLHAEQPPNSQNSQNSQHSRNSPSKPLFPIHVVNPNSSVPPPPPIDNLHSLHSEITNKFADLTLSRPKKNNKNSMDHVNPFHQHNGNHGQFQQMQMGQIQMGQMQQGQKSPSSSVSSGGPDGRSNLLAEIRKGRQLRKIQAQDKKEKELTAAAGGASANGFVDVAALLASRRMFIKDDSENEETSSTFGTEEDDEEWN